MASIGSTSSATLITLACILGWTVFVFLTPSVIDVQMTYLSTTMCYNRTELLSYNDGTGRQPSNVWNTLLSLGINARKPTHRGSKGTRSGLKRRHIRQLHSRNIELTTSLSSNRGTSCIKCSLWNSQSIRNKATMFSDYVLEHDLDCCFLVETWLKETDQVVVSELTPPGYTFISKPRNSSTYGGGIGALFKKELKLQIFETGLSFHSFELTCFTDISKEVLYFVIYRPGPSAKNGLRTSEFLSEFDIFIEFVNTLNRKAIIVGDLNLHLDIPSKPEVAHFLTTLDTAGFSQHVTEPTHVHEHILDPVMSRIEENLVVCCVVDSRLSDHHVVLFDIKQQKPRLQKKTVVSRRLNSVNQEAFQKDLSRELSMTSKCGNVDELVTCYENSVVKTLDKHAPIRSSTRNARPKHPWYNDEIHHSRRLRRKLERKWRKSRLNTDRQLYIEQRTATNALIEKSKERYYKNEFKNADCKTMFKKVNDLLNKNVKTLPIHESAQDLGNDFAMYFHNKIVAINKTLGSDRLDPMVTQPSVPCSYTLSEFNLLSEDDARKAISNAPTKSCTLDPVPTWFLKQNIESFVPIITNIINKSLTTGIFPDSLKHSIITPIIKKPSLDPNDLKNYRPVSNLSFLSKLIEKQACKTINEYLEKYVLGEQLQSAYKRAHSTETALMKVKDDIMKSVSEHKGVFLVLLDLSCAFDTVCHDYLINRLKNDLGIQGNVLQWFSSYLSNRTSTVCVDDCSSILQEMHFGLPQGSVVGPLGFTLYVLPIGHIIRSYGLQFHMYADDVQLYTCFEPKNPLSITRALNQLSSCIDALKLWMKHNMLMLNEDKTEFFVATTSHLMRSLPPVSLRVGDKLINPSDTVRNLGVLFDSQMSMSSHVKNLCSSLTYHLRNISRIRRFLDYDTCHHVIRALVLSKIDYGNGLLLGANKSDINRLQRIQNWAAKMICQVLKRDHATPCLQQLHWLPVEKRIIFKILLTVFKCHNQLSPGYLSASLVPYRPARASLRSASDTTLLTVHNTTKLLQSAERKTFYYAAPRMWNDLPVYLRECKTMSGFKKALKSYLYQSMY